MVAYFLTRFHSVSWFVFKDNNGFNEKAQIRFIKTYEIKRKASESWLIILYVKLPPVKVHSFKVKKVKIKVKQAEKMVARIISVITIFLA